MTEPLPKPTYGVILEPPNILSSLAAHTDWFATEADAVKEYNKLRAKQKKGIFPHTVVLVKVEKYQKVSEDG